MSNNVSGKCLCGAVRYQSSEPAMMAGHCYCEDCRRSSGTSHCTHVVMAEESFEITGTLSYFDKPANSGNVVKRGFCPTCGSAILSYNEAMPGMVFVRAASLDDLDQIEPGMTVYAARAPQWALIDHKQPVFDGEFPGLPEGKLPF